MFLFFKKLIDCFWLLSAIIEYACHNLVFSGFKETNSLSFESRDDLVVKSPNDNLKNYSKILGREEMTCRRLEFSAPKSIKEVSSDNVPTKK